jgi:hypothetical protein
LAKHAVSEGTKAVTKYTSSKWKWLPSGSTTIQFFLLDYFFISSIIIYIDHSCIHLS